MKMSMVNEFAVYYCNHHYRNCRHRHMTVITNTFTITSTMSLFMLLLLLLLLLLFYNFMPIYNTVAEPIPWAES